MLWRTTLLLAALSVESWCEQIAIHFKVIHEAIIACPDGTGTNEIQVNWKLVKYNRTMTVINGNIFFLRPLDDSLWVRAKLLSWKNGGWKAGTGLDFRKDKACSSFLMVVGPVWNDLAKIAHVPTKCPMKGNYTFTNWDSRAWDKLPLPGAPINKYKLEFSFETSDGTTRGCYSSIFKVLKK